MTTAAAQESPKPMVRDWAMTAHARLFFDARRHYYRYQVLALDLETLDLDKHFTLEDFEKTAKGHVLATAEVVGRYTLNPRLRSA